MNRARIPHSPKGPVLHLPPTEPPEMSVFHRIRSHTILTLLSLAAAASAIWATWSFIAALRGMH